MPIISYQVSHLFQILLRFEKQLSFFQNSQIIDVVDALSLYFLLDFNALITHLFKSASFHLLYIRGHVLIVNAQISKAFSQVFGIFEFIWRGIVSHFFIIDVIFLMDFNFINIVLNIRIIWLCDDLWLRYDIHHAFSFEQECWIHAWIFKWVFSLRLVANVQCIHEIFKISNYFSVQVLAILFFFKNYFIVLIDFFIRDLFVVMKEGLSLLNWKFSERFLKIQAWNIGHHVNIFIILLLRKHVLKLRAFLFLILHNYFHVNAVIIRRTIEIFLDILQGLVIWFDLVKIKAQSFPI